MILSKKGEDFIKAFESCSLTATKCVPTEKYYTIGWGHYGPDVKEGQKITQAEADALFKKDISKYYPSGSHTQSSFDALTSFHYNCGINAKESWTSRNGYIKSGGKVLKGLERRRRAEMLMDLAGVYTLATYPIKEYLKNRAPATNSKNCYKTLDTMIIQIAVGCSLIDGIFGPETDRKVREYQKAKKIGIDGIVGPITWSYINKMNM